MLVTAAGSTTAIVLPASSGWRTMRSGHGLYRVPLAAVEQVAASA
jgi:hypothetical protein